MLTIKIWGFAKGSRVMGVLPREFVFPQIVSAPYNIVTIGRMRKRLAGPNIIRTSSIIVPSLVSVDFTPFVKMSDER